MILRNLFSFKLFSAVGLLSTSLISEQDKTNTAEEVWKAFSRNNLKWEWLKTIKCVTLFIELNLLQILLKMLKIEFVYVVFVYN